ncbi:MAG: TetR family transcriptional regulator, partial [Actinobacteria bacterium]|nr:TetR family transcriptional regulator [Actinomycetota bacterium]
MTASSQAVKGDARTARSGAMRRRLIDAALVSLKERGYAGTSIRSIAAIGGFNSALISYYFGGLNQLLLAALDHSSSQRLERYRQAVDASGSLEELAGVAAQIYREDVAGGHITVFSELVAASLQHPELRAEIVARAEPWLDFVESAIRRYIEGTPFADIVPLEDVAYALVAFYLGVNLMTQLESDN